MIKRAPSLCISHGAPNWSTIDIAALSYRQSPGTIIASLKVSPISFPRESSASILSRLGVCAMRLRDLVDVTVLLAAWRYCRMCAGLSLFRCFCATAGQGGPWRAMTAGHDGGPIFGIRLDPNEDFVYLHCFSELRPWPFRIPARS